MGGISLRQRSQLRVHRADFLFCPNTRFYSIWPSCSMSVISPPDSTSASTSLSTTVRCPHAATSNGPARTHSGLVGGGQTYKQEIIALYLKGYLAPTIATNTNHSLDAVERYIRDFEAVRLLAPKFHDVDPISRIIRLTSRVVSQYLDLIPPDD